MKQFFAALLFFFSIPSFSCINALSTNDVNFCPSFKAAAICYCSETILPSFMCKDLHALYNRMLALFGSLENVCRHQHHTTLQDCIDGWSCYIFGGFDSLGRACSSTQRAC